ncbi:hypothetical protein, partial [Salmonella enterica]|uniref:hypothetical protein n=1 Tax=Salmonella enterica TaxID=28901 RepID=UPI0032984BD0
PRLKNAISLSSVAAQEGDRIQVEIGYRSTSTTSTYSATLEYGDPTSGSDMTLSASSSAGVPWIEFSANIAEPASGPPAFSGALALTGSGGLTLGVNALSVTGIAPL